MRMIAILAACALTLAPAGMATAQDHIASKIINDPTAPNIVGAKGALRDDAEVTGGKALRVTVTRAGKNNWDSVVETPVKKAVKAGDQLVLAFMARLVKADGGAATATLPYNAVQFTTAPYNGVVSGPVEVGPEWKQHEVRGRADKDYAAGTLKTTIQLGNAKQVVELGPVVLLNMGQ